MIWWNACLDECVDFIDQRRQATERVLVHCVAGISRSATISIAYTMKLFVKQKRPEISPNLGFMGQLLEYQRALTGTGGHNQQQDPKATVNKRTLPTILRPVQLLRPSERAPSVSFSPRQSPSFPNRIQSRRTRQNRMAGRSTRIRIFSCSRRSDGSDTRRRGMIQIDLQFCVLLFFSKSFPHVSSFTNCSFCSTSYNKSGMRLIYILLLLIYYCLSLIIIITVQCLTSFSPIVSTISQSKPANQQTNALLDAAVDLQSSKRSVITLRQSNSEWVSSRPSNGETICWLVQT